MMLIKIFDFLTSILYANIFIVILASFIWGVLSVILSPCHLSSIPLLVAYIGGQKKITVKKAFWVSLMFAFGILITLAFIGIITGMLGRMLGNLGFMEKIFVVIVSAIFILVGLNFLEIVPSPDFFKNGQPDAKNVGLIPAFLMGFLFGSILGPCTFGFMAPILGVVFSSAGKNPFYSFLILFMYALGHCLIIILAGIFTKVAQRYLNWNEKSNISETIKKIFGVIIIIIGIYLVIINFKINM